MAGDRLYFRVRKPIANYALWSADGTHEGTVRLDVIVPELIGAIEDVTVAENQVYFVARNHSPAEFLIWRADGPSQSTVRLGRFEGEWQNPLELVNLDQTLLLQ